LSTSRDALLDWAHKGEVAELRTNLPAAIKSEPNEFDFYMQVAERMRSQGKETQAGEIFSEVVDLYDDTGTPEQRVRLLTFVAGALKKERKYRLALIEALKAYHADKPALDVFIEPCGLKGDGSVLEALDVLEKMFAYDVGAYVLHASGWGVGKIHDIDPLAGELVIRFEDGRNHQMPVTSAMETLQILDPEDWRVLKTFDTERFQKMCSDDPGEVVARILRQVGRPLDTKTMRDMLEGNVIESKQWSKWWATARRNALKRRDVGQADGRASRLTYLEVNSEDSLEEMRQVLSAKQVLDLAQNYLRNLGEEEQANPEIIRELVPVLIQGATKHAGKNDPSSLELLMLADELSEEHGIPRDEIAMQMRGQVGDQLTFAARITACKNHRRQRRALAFLKEVLPDYWADRFVALVEISGSQLLEFLVDNLLEAGRLEDVQQLVREAYNKPEQRPEILIWARKRKSKERFAELLAPFDAKDLLLRTISLGQAVGKADRKLVMLQRAAVRDLVADNGKEFRQAISEFSSDSARLLLRRLDRARRMSDVNRMQMISILYDVHRDLHVEPDEVLPHDNDSVIYSTQQGIDKFRGEYEKLVNDDLPRIFEAVGKAASFGDLSENAEYTAALEERASMTTKAEKMQEDMRSAKPIDSELLIDGVATIGAKVHARNLASGEEVTYTLLGPWDADLDRAILDYHAPLAQAFLTHKAGETVIAEFGGRQHEYEILSIEPGI
jgi:transcription elongation GreA/GreB family factor